MEVLFPTLTTVFPVMVPVMMTIFLVALATAEVSASSVLTVAVVPPEPPVVLRTSKIC